MWKGLCEPGKPLWYQPNRKALSALEQRTNYVSGESSFGAFKGTHSEHVSSPSCKMSVPQIWTDPVGTIFGVHIKPIQGVSHFFLKGLISPQNQCHLAMCHSSLPLETLPKGLPFSLSAELSRARARRWSCSSGCGITRTLKRSDSVSSARRLHQLEILVPPRLRPTVLTRTTKKEKPAPAHQSWAQQNWGGGSIDLKPTRGRRREVGCRHGGPDAGQGLGFAGSFARVGRGLLEMPLPPCLMETGGGKMERDGFLAHFGVMLVGWTERTWHLLHELLPLELRSNDEQTTMGEGHRTKPNA